MTFYQACYGKPGNNWQLLNVSPETPPAMISFFEKLGNGCTPTAAFPPKDATDLCLYQMISDENVVCALRAIYSGLDNYGRPKMFAHGFMYSAEGALTDPNTVLSIADSNFRFTAEETANIPETLAQDAALTMDGALATLQLDRAKLNRLMACVHALLAGINDAPLYIVGNTDMATVKAAIYCILTALPTPLRYQLSFSNANSLQNATFKRIMFVEQAPNYENFFELATGETNVDFSALEQEPEKYPAYHLFAGGDATAFESYCASLEKAIRELNLGYNADYRGITTAQLFLQDLSALDGKDDTELTKQLVALLTGAPLQNAFADQYIAGILQHFVRRGIIPNETIMQRIEMRSDVSPCPEYVEVYKSIKTKFLLSKGAEEIVGFLTQLHAKSKEIYEEWYRLISEMEGGVDAIALYHQKRIKACNNYQEIHAICVELGQLYQRQDIRACVQERCVYFLKTRFSAANVQKCNFEEDLGRHNNFCERMGLAPISDEELKNIKENFWSYFKFTYFVIDEKALGNCGFMFFENAPKICNQTIRLLHLQNAISKLSGGTGTVEDVINRAVSIANSRYPITPDYEQALEKLQNYALSQLPNEKTKSFRMWLELADLKNQGENPLEQMILWNLPIICDEDTFLDCFDMSPELQEMSDQLSEWMVGPDQKSGLLPKLEIRPELYKSMKKMAKYMADFKKKKAAEEKKAEKEQRKAAKKGGAPAPEFVDSSEPSPYYEDPFQDEAKEEPASSKGGIFGMFKKKK